MLCGRSLHKFKCSLLTAQHKIGRSLHPAGSGMPPPRAQSPEVNCGTTHLSTFLCVVLPL